MGAIVGFFSGVSQVRMPVMAMAGGLALILAGSARAQVVVQAQEADAQAPASLSEDDRVAVAILMDRLLEHTPQADGAGPGLDVIETTFSHAVFPGDDPVLRRRYAEYAGDEAQIRPAVTLPSAGDHPFAVEETEQWYLGQVGGTFVGSNFFSEDPVRIAYLPQCNRTAKTRVISALFPDYDIESDDFDAWHLDLALALSVVAAEGIDPQTVDWQREELRTLYNGCLAPDAIASINRALNEAIVRGGAETAPPLLVLRRYIPGPARSPALFAGVMQVTFTSNAAYAYAYSSAMTVEQFFFVDLPDGMTRARLLRGIDAIKCERHARPLYDMRCKGRIVVEEEPIRLEGRARHRFIGRANGETGNWVTGEVDLRTADIWTPNHPAPPPGSPYEKTNGVRPVRFLPDIQ